MILTFNVYHTRVSLCCTHSFRKQTRYTRLVFMLILMGKSSKLKVLKFVLLQNTGMVNAVCALVPPRIVLDFASAKVSVTEWTQMSFSNKLLPCHSNSICTGLAMNDFMIIIEFSFSPSLWHLR